MIGLTLLIFEEGQEDGREDFIVPSLPEAGDEISIDGYSWEILEIYLEFNRGEPQTKWVAEVVPISDDDTEDDPDGLDIPVPEGDNILEFARKVA